MPTVQIVPLPGIELGEAHEQPFAMIVEWTDTDDGVLPAQEVQERYNAWANSCGAKAIMHTLDSISLYYPRQYLANAETATPGPCPSAAENPFNAGEYPAVAAEFIPCGLLALHPGRHSAQVQGPDGDDTIIVWGDLEIWPQPPHVMS